MRSFSITSLFNKYQSRSRQAVPVPAQVWQNPLYFIAFGFGSGVIPFAPGTFGTLAAIPFYLLIQPLPFINYLILTVLFTLGSMWICDQVSREIHSHDHPGMCLDEFAGFFVTMIGAPTGAFWIITGFILFRLFDIWKPWPIRYLDENIHGGTGMVLDDVAAGFAAMLLLQLLRMIVA